jgi:hypothetical protein
LRRQAVDVALDGEQRIDAGDGFDRDRRLGQPRQVEELASRYGQKNGPGVDIHL